MCIVYYDSLHCLFAIPGFLNKELKLPGIDSYAAYGRTPTSSFNCSTEYHIGDTKIEYCDLTFDVCMKHVRDPDVDRVEDLRLPFMVMANILDTWFPWCIVRMHFNSPDRPSGRASTS